MILAKVWSMSSCNSQPFLMATRWLSLLVVSHPHTSIPVRMIRMVAKCFSQNCIFYQRSKLCSGGQVIYSYFLGQKSVTWLALASGKMNKANLL